MPSSKRLKRKSIRVYWGTARAVEKMAELTGMTEVEIVRTAIARLEDDLVKQGVWVKGPHSYEDRSQIGNVS
jgi:hypothetical protein